MHFLHSLKTIVKKQHVRKRLLYNQTTIKLKNGEELKILLNKTRHCDRFLQGDLYNDLFDS